MPRHSSTLLSAPLVRLLVVLLSLECLAGCGGCGSDAAKKAQTPAEKAKAEAEKKKQEEEAKKNKEPFKMQPITPLLSEVIISTENQEPIRLAKPGHWTATVQRMLANLDNFNGRNTVAATDSRQRPVTLPETEFAIISSRPALLAKGRAKRVMNELLPPAGNSRASVSSTLEAPGGAAVDAREDLWTMMPSHQYFLAVLASEPARYAYLSHTDAVEAPFQDENGVEQPHYRVALIDGAKAMPLPDNVLAWTSVAYVVWDEVNIDRMTPEQQQALVDWIHWGGRLIVNGPDSLAALRGSFLAPYLPADGGDARQIGDGDLAALNEFWSVRAPGTPRPAPLKATKPWSAVVLKPHADALPLAGADGLFYEAPVGAGSVVVSAFQLAERDFINWPGFDGFLNGALLRRPGRLFREEADDLSWVGLQAIWKNQAYRDHARDAYFTTPLRWFARDFGTAANSSVSYSQPAINPTNPWGGMPLEEATAVVDRPGGLGAWNEFSDVSNAARQSLSDAAGVRVPGASFVVTCLAVYLLILVPLNWALFYALGRVEWAWIAAPLIALAGTVAVVRQAQLDIGFVRSQTEISLLELQGPHPRGHLSRYMALYTSLSTVYNTEFADGSAVATPFPARAARDPREAALSGSMKTVEFEKYDKPRLKGLPVSSATTQFLHSEQMLPLAGGLRLSHPSTNPRALQLENKTGYDLSDAVVIHRRPSGSGWRYEGCWLGQVRSDTSQLLNIADLAPERDRLLFAAERAAAAEFDPHKRLNVDGLLKLAFRFDGLAENQFDPLQGGRDEWRLVARIDEPLPGAQTSPAASQVAGSTVVLAHLDYQLNPITADHVDANSAKDVTSDRRNAYDELLNAEPTEEVF
jgi:hypothetical protein